MNLRHGTTHGVLACWFGVDRSTITARISAAGVSPMGSASPLPASGASPQRRSDASGTRPRSPARFRRAGDASYSGWWCHHSSWSRITRKLPTTASSTKTPPRPPPCPVRGATP
ncbi:transposase family protein [Streptomyces sp. NPDC056656]|uniref:transposase family protein n=1 Tax=Streptomyces sp. NPDC056656 TaxID=3345895 RepID=UPI0036C7817C